MKIILAYFAQTFFVLSHEQHTSEIGEQHVPSLRAGLDDEQEIPHARLAHFPAQIGHWSVSQRLTAHNQ